MEKGFNWLDEYGAELDEVDQHHERFARIIEEITREDDKTVIRRIREEVRFGWIDAYNTGIKAIDSQHKHFLEILENLAAINNGASTCARTEKLLDELVDYARLHFQSEERLMERYAYPNLASHRKEHEVFTKELHRQVESLKKNKGPSAKLLYFLVQWFLKHTLYTDQEIGRYINGQKHSLPYRLKRCFPPFSPFRFFRRR